MTSNELLSNYRNCITNSDNTISIVCPFHEQSISGDVADFVIEEKDGSGYCSICKRNFTFSEIADLLGIIDVKKIADGEVIFAKKESVSKIKKNEYQQIREKKEYKILTVKEILETDYGEQSWLVEGIIPLNGITIIAGAPGNFKSWITQDIARCVSLGTDFLGHFKVIKGSVLVIDSESYMRLVQKRFKSIGGGDSESIYYHVTTDWQIQNQTDVDFVLKVIREKNIKLVIFDSLVRIHSGNENDAVEMSKVFKKFKYIAEQGNVTIFIVHHNRKENPNYKTSMESMRGSIDISAANDSQLMIKKVPDENRLVITQTKLKEAEKLKPFSVTFEKDGEDIKSFVYEGNFDSSKNARLEIREAILEIFNESEKPEITRPEILDVLKVEGYHNPMIDNTLKELVAENVLTKRKGSSGTNIFQLKE